MFTNVVASVLSVLVAFGAIAAAAAQDLALPGPFSAGNRTVIVTRSGGTTFSARLFYPATAPGTGTPLAPSDLPYPAFTFGHGFFQPVSRYTSTLEHLATHGVIAIATESESSIFPNHTNYAADLSRCLTWLEQQNISGASFLFRAVDVSAFGAGGHSMGGGASLLAAATDPRIRLVFTLAAADTNPSSIAASASILAPTFHLCGTADTIVPPGSSGQLMYNNAPGPRQYLLIAGGSHCGFQDVNSFGCDALVMPRATQLAITRRELTRAARLYLGGDRSLWPQVWGPGRLTEPSVTTTLDANANVEIDPTARIIPALPFEIPISITNSGTTPAAFALTASVTGSPAIVVSFPIAETPAINPGAVWEGVIAVAASPGSYADAATVRVVARSLADGGTHAFADVSVVAACRGDADGDDDTDSGDISTFFARWEASETPADVDADGDTDSDDIVAFFSAWDGGC